MTPHPPAGETKKCSCASATLSPWRLKGVRSLFPGRPSGLQRDARASDGGPWTHDVPGRRMPSERAQGNKSTNVYKRGLQFPRRPEYKDAWRKRC